MKTVTVESGVCLGFGGTNARKAICSGGDITGYSSVETPTQPRKFFGWMGRQVLDAAQAGNGWLVAGYPGPVSSDGKLVGPLTNVVGMARRQYNLREELIATDPEVGRVLDQGFILLGENDGNLAAQAAAARIGGHKYARTGALILGTGVGSGVVDKDPNYSNVHRADSKHPYEIGHILLSDDPFDRFEDSFSGPGLERRYHANSRDLPADHPAWRGVGRAVGRLSTTMSIMSGVDLIVPCGGVGSGASEKYAPHLEDFMDSYRKFGNGPQQLFAPEIIPVPPEDCQVFEMFGAEGVVRDFLSRAD
ncbi:MAG: hypothetical protein ACQR33_01055 [Candidatus Saccharibacteria bacterium]